MAGWAPLSCEKRLSDEEIVTGWVRHVFSTVLHGSVNSPGKSDESQTNQRSRMLVRKASEGWNTGRRTSDQMEEDEITDNGLGHILG